jgi:hypothetical protein
MRKTVPPGAVSLAVPTVGSLRNFRINTGAGGCTSYNEVTARVVYVSQRAVLYEDIAAPLAGTMNSYYAQMGQAFDATMYPSDLANFADPLITDPYTDADQHINMVFSKRVNDMGLGGFVISCDFSPRTVANPSSNYGENLYGRVATIAGTGFAPETAGDWYRTMRTVVVHEVKHIASSGWRFVNGAPAPEEVWLEESTARQAEELWLRNYVYDAGAWKSNITYAGSIYCEVRQDSVLFPQCLGRPYGIIIHFDGLYTYLENPATHSPLGAVASGDYNFYESGWSLLRWSADRFASSEASFFKGLTQSMLTGMTNLRSVTGGSTVSILGNWSLALFFDGNAAFLSNSNLNVPTWNLRDIYAGMHADFPTDYPRLFPLVPVAMTGGNTQADVATVRGGSFATFDFSGSAPIGRAISVVGYGGSGIAPSSLRISIARLQ